MKIACFFPGIGYTADRPLLYFSRKITKAAGYEIITVPYVGFESGIFGDKEKMKRAVRRKRSLRISILKNMKISFLSPRVWELRFPRTTER